MSDTTVAQKLVIVGLVLGVIMIIYHIATRGTKAAFAAGLGGACDDDSDCSAGKCGYVSAASGADTVCCAATGYDGFSYCTGMPPGAACWTGAMCASGSCSSTGAAQGQCA